MNTPVNGGRLHRADPNSPGVGPRLTNSRGSVAWPCARRRCHGERRQHDAALFYATGYSGAIRHLTEDAADRQERAAYRVAELNPRARDEEDHA